MTKRITLLFLAISIFAFDSSQWECGVRGKSKHPNVYIVGGYTVEPGEYPWMTVMGGCGSFLIGDQWVLTAGHCANKHDLDQVHKEGREWFVFIDVYDTSLYQYQHYPYYTDETTAVRRNVTKIIRHPLYEAREDRPDNGRAHYDVSLVKFTEPLDLNGADKHIQPLCLPNSTVTEDELLQSYCTVIGFGGPDGKLTATSVPIISSEFCRHKYPEDFNSTDMICGGHLDGGHGTCNGDSGGPLQCRLADGKWYAVGAVSWGVPCAKPGWPDVYANLVHLSDWIRTAIKQELGDDTPASFTCPTKDIAATACKGPRDCLYPYPGDCFKYILCQVNADNRTGRPTVNKCPDGLSWNDRKKICDEPLGSTCPSDHIL